jgi:hypothetical protein
MGQLTVSNDTEDQCGYATISLGAIDDVVYPVTTRRRKRHSRTVIDTQLARNELFVARKEVRVSRVGAVA